MITGDVYLLFGASGEWEDYHEYIVGIYDNRESAVVKMKQLLSDQEKDLAEWKKVVTDMTEYEQGYDIESIWEENCPNVSLDDYLDDPDKYQDCLQLFIPPEAQIIREYTKLTKRFDELGGFCGNEINDVIYSVRVYYCSTTGDMEWKNTIYQGGVE